VALITDMDQPLGRTAGHANEVAECIEVLNGGGPADLRELSLELCAWMFYLGEQSKSVDEGHRLAEDMIASGRAREKFKKGIALQGGDERVVDEPNRLPKARFRVDVPSPAAGYISGTDSQQFGIALAVLGGGREKKEDAIDPAVGIVVHKKLGDKVTAGEALCTVHYNSEENFERAKSLIQQSYTIGKTPASQRRPLVGRIIGEESASAASF